MIDVSPRGALIGLAMEDFLPSGGSGSLMEVASLVPKRFPDGMTIRVLTAEFRLEATVVRVAAGTSEPHILFGCLFRRLLTRRQCRALGVVEIEPGDEPRFAS